MLLDAELGDYSLINLQEQTSYADKVSTKLD